MKIINNKEIECFLSAGMNNIHGSRLNDYLGKIVKPSEERIVQKELGRAGAQEFEGDPDLWPSLFISAAKWQMSPFHNQISLDDFHDAHYSIETAVIDPFVLFNADAIQKDQRKQLGDWMKLRALDQPVKTTILYQDDKDWMLDAPSEAATNDPAARKAHGNVITFGLGIGYFVFMATRNPAVRSITVVEHSQEVIDLFQHALWPQFPHQVPLTLICDDAYRWFRKDKLEQYDYCYADIWQSSNDGLFCIEKMLEQYNPPLEKADFWIEDSCMEQVWTLVFLYFHELANNQIHEVNPQFKKIMKKIRRYFSAMPDTVADDHILKEIMYDRSVLRQILAQK